MSNNQLAIRRAVHHLRHYYRFFQGSEPALSRRHLIVLADNAETVRLALIKSYFFRVFEFAQSV
jgi:hypothetical protein